MGPDSVRYLHTDERGSVVATTDADRTVRDAAGYDPFGLRRGPNPANPSAGVTAFPERVGFTGFEEDQELGLVNMGGRLYDPKVGRFTSADPFVTHSLQPQSYNRYSYAMNDPTNRTDPSGFQDEGGVGNLQAILVDAQPRTTTKIMASWFDPSVSGWGDAFDPQFALWLSTSELGRSCGLRRLTGGDLFRPATFNAIRSYSGANARMPDRTLRPVRGTAK